MEVNYSIDASNANQALLEISIILNEIYAGIVGANPDFQYRWLEPQGENDKPLFLILGLNLELADPRVVEAVRHLEQTIQETEFREPETINPSQN